ncbi:DUF4907 domain-containing protein [Parasediminibacterium paludis]|uniref:DUF4907 domain-containing protein n=1 Tax=Parasediminibacterium paludis TaxID=908966 RepID=A0ABV8PZ57_9BACT
MIKKNWIYVLFALSVIVFTITEYQKHRQNAIVAKAKQLSTGGWGYDIYVKDVVYISQDIIPSITGRKTFASEKDALKVGNLMVAKMKNNLRPVITDFELDSLNIVR